MKQKYAWVVFIISILTLVPFRIYQKVVLNQNLSSFFGIKKVDFGVVVTFLVFVLIINTMIFISKNSSYEIKIRKNISTGVLAMASGILVLVSSMCVAANTFNLWNENKELLSALQKTNDVSAEFVKAEISVQTITLIRCTLGILVFACFVAMFMSSLKGVNLFRNREVLSLFPTIWAILKVVEILMARLSAVSQNSDIFAMIEAICLLMFLFVQAKVFAHVEDEKKNKKLFSFGFMAVISMAVYNMSSLAYLFHSESASFVELISYITNLVLAVYIVFFLIDASRPALEVEQEFMDVVSNENEKSLSEEAVREEVNEDLPSTENVEGDKISVDEEMIHVNDMIDKIENSGEQ